MTIIFAFYRDSAIRSFWKAGKYQTDLVDNIMNGTAWCDNKEKRRSSDAIITLVSFMLRNINRTRFAILSTVKLFIHSRCLVDRFRSLFFCRSRYCSSPHSRPINLHFLLVFFFKKSEHFPVFGWGPGEERKSLASCVMESSFRFRCLYWLFASFQVALIETTCEFVIERLWCQQSSMQTSFSELTTVVDEAFSRFLHNTTGITFCGFFFPTLISSASCWLLAVYRTETWAVGSAN